MNPKVLEMIRQYIAANGDPFAPYETMTNYAMQTTEVKCNGCDAVGTSSWPRWELKITHQPDCAWLAWRELVK